MLLWGTDVNGTQWQVQCFNQVLLFAEYMDDKKITKHARAMSRDEFDSLFTRRVFA